MYDHKAIIYNNTVRNNFQIQLSNQFEHLQIEKDDSAQTAYHKLVKAVEEAASSLPKKNKTTNKP